MKPFEEFCADLGLELEETRKAKGWTQEVAAVNAGVSRDTIISVEKGKLGRVFELYAVINAMDIPLHKLLVMACQDINMLLDALVAVVTAIDELRKKEK